MERGSCQLRAKPGPRRPPAGQLSASSQDAGWARAERRRGTSRSAEPQQQLSRGPKLCAGSTRPQAKRLGASVGDAFESTIAHGAVCTFPESASALLWPLTVTPPPAGVPAARLFPPGPREPCWCRREAAQLELLGTPIMLIASQTPSSLPIQLAVLDTPADSPASPPPPRPALLPTWQ
jgi:hypothetical protein